MIGIHPHRKSFWFYLFEGVFSGFQWISAKIQASRILRNLPVSHFWWAVGTAVVIVGMALLYKRITRCSWKETAKLAAALILLRFLEFTPFLNKLRGKKMFYIGQMSVVDRAFATVYVWAWWTSLLEFIYFQFM